MHLVARQQTTRLKRWSAVAPLVIVLLMISIYAPVRAQMYQPAAPTTPATRNPQVQGPQNLSASVTSLQGSAGPQVLGASIGDSTPPTLRVLVPQSVAVAVPPSFADDPINHPEDLKPQSPVDNNLLVRVVGGTTATLCLLAIYFAAKRRPS